MPSVDPITTEVIRYLFISAAEEIKINLARSGYNPVVFEMLDFAVGIIDADANMIAQAPGLPAFLGTLRGNVKTITEDIGGPDNFRPGDAHLMNDPYFGWHSLAVDRDRTPCSQCDRVTASDLQSFISDPTIPVEMTKAVRIHLYDGPEALKYGSRSASQRAGLATSTGSPADDASRGWTDHCTSHRSVLG